MRLSEQCESIRAAVSIFSINNRHSQSDIFISSTGMYSRNRHRSIAFFKKGRYNSSQGGGCIGKHLFN